MGGRVDRWVGGCIDGWVGSLLYCVRSASCRRGRRGGGAGDGVVLDGGAQARSRVATSTSAAAAFTPTSASSRTTT